MGRELNRSALCNKAAISFHSASPQLFHFFRTSTTMQANTLLPTPNDSKTIQFCALSESSIRGMPEHLLISHLKIFGTPKQRDSIKTHLINVNYTADQLLKAQQYWRAQRKPLLVKRKTPVSCALEAIGTTVVAESFQVRLRLQPVMDRKSNCNFPAASSQLLYQP